MESRRIFYTEGGHDEIPLGEIVENGDYLDFSVVNHAPLHVLRTDILCIEER